MSGVGKNYEMESQRAVAEMKQRNQELQFVKDHQMEFEKELEQIHRAKAQEEAAKGKKWEEERLIEDLEMQEAIDARSGLLKQKLVDVSKARDEADNKARLIEAAKIEEKKAFQEKNIEEIALEKLLEEEQRKRDERAQWNQIVIQRKDETDQLRLHLERGALELEKEKRTRVLELQGAELNRYEQEIKEGGDTRARKRAEKQDILEKQIEDEKITFDIELERQKLRDQEKERKKDQITQETRKHEAELLTLLEAQKQSKKERDFDDLEQDEERLRLEGLKRRQQQQQQIMDQQDAEMELLMKSRKNRDDNQDEPANDTKPKKKGIFSSLFGRRSPKPQ